MTPTLRLPDRPCIDWLAKSGVKLGALLYPDEVLIERDAEGVERLLFSDGSWQPRTGEIRCDGFCLGEDAITDPSTYFADGALTIHENPLAWMRAGRRWGIVVQRWDMAFDRLRDVPRIVLPVSLKATYDKHMRPVRMPKVRIA